MVNYGPSRGCNTCKKRRKKCDKARPYCTRCVKANRTCTGYDEGAFSTFKQYQVQPLDPSLSNMLTIASARKCSLPKRVPIPGSHEYPEDDFPLEVTIEEGDMYVTRCFFYDYCTVSANTNLSRSYLPGVDTMIHRLGMKSDVAKACQAVCFAAHAKSLNRPSFTTKSELMYQELLRSLAVAIINSPAAHTAESRVVAMLLGLYEIITADETNYGSHEAHAKGLAALLKVRSMPLTGILSAPALHCEGGNLDELVIQLDSLWVFYQNESSFEVLCSLKDDMVALDTKFEAWQTSRGANFSPTVVSHIPDRQDRQMNIEVGQWPGDVHTYFDLYVAGAWNILRSARLLLTSMIIELSARLGDDENSVLVQTAGGLVDDILASVAYHLTDNLQVFLSGLETGEAYIDRGRILGAMLLIHPLYVASQVPMVSKVKRQHVQKCLAWIGSEVGIGQAALLSKTPNIDMSFLKSGCMIIWAGFLEPRAYHGKGMY